MNVPKSLTRSEIIAVACAFALLKTSAVLVSAIVIDGSVGGVDVMLGATASAAA
jgi:hypothetical protein